MNDSLNRCDRHERQSGKVPVRIGIRKRRKTDRGWQIASGAKQSWSRVIEEGQRRPVATSCRRSGARHTVAKDARMPVDQSQPTTQHHHDSHDLFRAASASTGWTDRDSEHGMENPERCNSKGVARKCRRRTLRGTLLMGDSNRSGIQGAFLSAHGSRTGHVGGSSDGRRHTHHERNRTGTLATVYVSAIAAARLASMRIGGSVAARNRDEGPFLLRAFALLHPSR